MQKPLVLTVTQLSTYLKSLFEGDRVLQSLFLTGEISNFTNHYQSGHLYFSLKDAQSTIRVVMFAGSAKRLRFLPKDGMNVLVRGRVSVYEATGQYQLYAEDLQPAGLGALSLAYEQLKERLAGEGLFDSESKLALPKYPQKIGVVTSPTGAAVQDILTVLARRFPLAEVLLYPAQVQGEGAAAELVRALEALNAQGEAEVIILGRGGGSMEDLWAFNEEALARAVAASRIPIISAVGHETDFTICDFVADLRAPTPSAAAELAVPDAAEVLTQLSVLRARMERAVKLRGDSAQKSREQLDGTLRSLRLAMGRRLARERDALAAAAGRLNALSPLGVLARGYAIACDARGGVLTESARAVVGEEITVRLHHGSLRCTINGKAEDNA